ncbi:type 1 glutamine amidotransferase [Uliginosibacterium sediminicola]|uniref:Type 1 glutamine amidotransferase n=1 Tax=Uliginosibacterium sediminicola TaxID=2024550 RepID=A0ABU9Z2P1_9RHOO
MKPVAVIQHCHNVRPGHFASFLDSAQIPWQLFTIDAGGQLPTDVEAFSGLCFMGGPMSVNDDLPWIAEELALIRQAVAAGVPVIGHCLGGQLLSRALGGEVTRNPVKEIGWNRVSATDTPEAQAWLGEAREFDVYQWHGETFSLPPGAVRILEGETCRNQAYVIGPHLGMQFHIEMTEELIKEWIAEWGDEFDAEASLPPSVQTPAQQTAQLPQALPRMRAVADQLYTHWARHLRG